VRRWATTAVVLGAILVVAAVLRICGINHGLPEGYYPDETHFLKRALAFGSFDFNPHWFHKPSFFMYLLFSQFGMYFLAGRLVGRFVVPEDLALEFLGDPTAFYLIGRLTTTVFGLLGILITARIARRVAGPGAGLAAAILLSFTAAQVASCQNVKADIPSTFFTLWSLLFLVRAAQNNRVRDWLACGFIAGLGMGTKYYAIFLLLPIWVTGFVVSIRGQRSEDSSRGPFSVRSADAMFGILSLTTVLFLLGFFIASPYNFLDPFWYDVNVRPMIKARSRGFLPFLRFCDLFLGARLGRTNFLAGMLFTAGGYVTFTGGRRAALWLAAAPSRRLALRILAVGLPLLLALAPTLLFPRYLESVRGLLSVVLSPEGMGPVLGGFCLLSLLALLLRRDRIALLLGAALVSFVIIANVYLPGVAEPRHLNVVYPLLCVSAALLLHGLLQRTSMSSLMLPGAAAVLALPGLVSIVRHDLLLLQVDTRSEAKAWIEANIPAGARIVNDKDWVKLFPSVERIREQKRLAANEADGSAFAVHRNVYLDLQEKAAARHHGRTYDVLVLDPPWWVSAERDEGSYDDTAHDRDMGDPSAHRIPFTLDEYRGLGYVYVVTTSKTFNQYTREPFRSRWPSLAAFYDELFELEPIYVLEADSRRPGPEVRIYSLQSAGGRSS
jgi:4-amino-4-deoxy-L-arabinose transferase-like glycosyltransferase